MASPDTIMLLIVDYRAAIGGKTPVVPPCVRALLSAILIMQATDQWRIRLCQSKRQTLWTFITTR